MAHVNTLARCADADAPAPSTAQHSTAQHSTAQHSTAQRTRVTHSCTTSAPRCIPHTPHPTPHALLIRVRAPTDHRGPKNNLSEESSNLSYSLFHKVSTKLHECNFMTVVTVQHVGDRVQQKWHVHGPTSGNTGFLPCTAGPHGWDRHDLMS